jgi:hypothetical protein
MQPDDLGPISLSAMSDDALLDALARHTAERDAAYAFTAGPLSGARSMERRRAAAVRLAYAATRTAEIEAELLRRHPPKEETADE